MPEVEVRTAIGVHHTGTSDGAWDGPANEARLPNDRRALRAAHAWVDSEGDPDAKSSYKFIHHAVSGDGEVGDAVMMACSSGIGVLNGGRGGANIPDGDRSGVHAHLAAHMMDGKMEPAPMRADSPKIEVRIAAETWAGTDLEVRAAEDDGMTFEGYAAVFNSDSQPISDMGRTFIERIAPGAFRKSLAERKGNIRMFLNHNADNLLATTRAKTLSLEEDDRGLRVRAQLPDTQAGRDLSTLIRRGDVNSMSFGFTPVREKWSEDYAQRELVEVKLWEVSPVTGWPAYTETQAFVRHLAEQIAEDVDELEEAFRVLSDETARLSTEQRDLLLRVINARTDEKLIAPNLARWQSRAAVLGISL